MAVSGKFRDFRIAFVGTFVFCQVGLILHCACALSAEVKHKEALPAETGYNLPSTGSSWATKNSAVSQTIQFLHDVSDVCRENRTFLVIIVCSAIDHFTQRDAIRRTWGSIVSSTKPEVKLIFLLGQHPVKTTLASKIENEATQFADIIQADFIDSYANLTIKSVVMLHWMTSHCACARFLLKSDDDSFINTPLLLRGLGNTVHRRFIMGSVIARAQPIRQPEAKWYTPNSVFNRTAYPNYVSGAAYVISGDVIDDLYRAAADTPLFWIEDVYVTGLLARQVGVQLVVNVKFDGYKELGGRCSIRKHIVQHHVGRDVMERLWTDVISEDLKCGNANQRL